VGHCGVREGGQQPRMLASEACPFAFAALFDTHLVTHAFILYTHRHRHRHLTH